MSTFPLSILSPEGELFSGEAESVSVPSPDGRWGIYPNRADCVIALAPGSLCYRAEGVDRSLRISSGIFRFEGNRGTALVTVAKTAE